MFRDWLTCPWNSLSKNAGVGSHSLLHRIFLAQESNLGLLHCRQILYCLSHQVRLCDPKNKANQWGKHGGCYCHYVTHEASGYLCFAQVHGAAQGKCKPLVHVQFYSQHDKRHHFPTRVNTIDLPMLSLQRRWWHPTPVLLHRKSNPNPTRLQSMGSLRVGHDWATSLSLFTFMHWRRKWQATPVFLPGESRDGGAWWAAIYGVTQSRTRLKRISSSSSMLSLNTYILSIFNF